MKTYVGSKILRAEPANRPDDNAEGYRVLYPDGYVSWSPKATFESAYREVTADEVRAVFEGMEHVA